MYINIYIYIYTCVCMARWRFFAAQCPDPHNLVTGPCLATHAHTTRNLLMYIDVPHIAYLTNGLPFSVCLYATFSLPTDYCICSICTYAYIPEYSYIPYSWIQYVPSFSHIHIPRLIWKIPLWSVVKTLLHQNIYSWHPTYTTCYRYIL